MEDDNNDSDEQTSVLPKIIVNSFGPSSSSTLSGDVKYYWNQNWNSIELWVPLGCTLSFFKLLKLSDLLIKRDYIKIGLKGCEPIVVGRLEHAVKPSKSRQIHSLNTAGQIHVILDKLVKWTWWSRVIVDDDKDPLQKISAKRIYGTYSDDRLMFPSKLRGICRDHELLPLAVKKNKKSFRRSPLPARSSNTLPLQTCHNNIFTINHI